LYLTKSPGSSSIYEPNYSENNKYKNHYHDPRVLDKKTNIFVDKMDNLIKISPDFIKIDTQGSEFEILNGSIDVLKNNCPLISLETWTRDVYKGSPTFDKIIPFLTDLGYEILDMELCAAEKHKNSHNIISKHTVSGYEIVFGRKNLELINDDEKLKYLILLDLFGYRDMALYLNENYLNNPELESYIVNNGRFFNNIVTLYRKFMRAFQTRIVKDPYYKISD
jgi:hypothetical protein